MADGDKPEPGAGISEPVRKSMPTEETDKELVKFAREHLYFKSTDVLDEMAKNLVNMVSVIASLFTGIVALFQLSERVNPLLTAFFVLPVICWLISIYKNISVYSPRKYTFQEKNPKSIEETIDEINDHKFKKLEEGTVFFIAGLLLLVIAIIVVALWNLAAMLISRIFA